jgi:hypothetical protein
MWREELRLRFFEHKVLKRIFGQESVENYIKRSSMICTSIPILFG